MTMWRRAMNYLGLGPDEDYYDDEPAAAQRSRGTSMDESTISVRPTVERVAGRSGSNVREIPNRESRVQVEETPLVVARPRQGSAVRTVAASVAAKPHTVAPRSFNDAQEVGDRFRDGTPVIVNLEGVDKDLSRRIVDFTSGLCYALSGRMERIAKDVFLLTPAAVEVSDEERQRFRADQD